MHQHKKTNPWLISSFLTKFFLYQFSSHWSGFEPNGVVVSQSKDPDDWFSWALVSSVCVYVNCKIISEAFTLPVFNELFVCVYKHCVYIGPI